MTLPEIIQPGALEAQERAMVDIQIATAHRFPRNVVEAVRNCELVVANYETAIECVYSRPVGRDRNGAEVYATGPSIRLAELLLQEWGNLTFAYRVIDRSDTTITAQAVVHDLQKNVRGLAETTKSIVGRNKRRFGDQQVEVVGAAACSIALRNATFRVIPKAHWGSVLDKAQRIIEGGPKELGKRVTAALAFFKERGVPEDNVLRAVKREKPSQVTGRDLVILLGLAQALREGSLDASEVGQIKTAEQRAEEAKAELLGAMKEQQTEKTSETSKESLDIDEGLVIDLESMIESAEASDELDTCEQVISDSAGAGKLDPETTQRLLDAIERKRK